MQTAGREADLVWAMELSTDSGEVTMWTIQRPFSMSPDFYLGEWHP